MVWQQPDDFSYTAVPWVITPMPPDVTCQPNLETVWELTDAEALHHLRVMRLEPGDALVLVPEMQAEPPADAVGYRATVRETAKHALIVTLDERIIQPAPAAPVYAVVALLKGHKWDTVLQKLTELGVDTLIPLQAERSIPQVDAKWAQKRARWQEIIRHAAQQSERLRPMALAEPCRIADLPQRLPSGAQCLAGAERGGVPLLAHLKTLATDQPVVFAVGPEGGWTAAERKQLDAAGFAGISLGPRILRSETAALALASVLALRG